MAERPVFTPSAATLVREIPIRFAWNAGLAAVQKQKNVRALHEAASQAGLSPVLEVSTKSERKLGRHLSAFHLQVRTQAHGPIPLECAFQGSKVFERGGPYVDLYVAEPRAAKQDARLRESGRLTGFAFEGAVFPTQPMTAFYDWLYVLALYPHRVWLQRLQRYAAFSDIEFNPDRSVNCQARSCALFVALVREGLLDQAVASPHAFVVALNRRSYRPGAGGIF